MADAGFTIREGNDAPLLRELTTLRLGGRARAMVHLHEAGAAAALPELANRLGGKLATIGAGSNILAGDGELPLVLVKLALDPEISEPVAMEGKFVVRAAASVKLPVLLHRLAAQDIGGLEGLTGIPGTVGGAVAMNAGSYGQCVADTLTALTVVTEQGEVKTLSRAEVDFAYRHMAIPGLFDSRGTDGWFAVLAAEFALTREEPGAVTARATEHMARKKITQPVTAASAGCVFKNPENAASAGKLLDDAGFKGKRLGGMAFSEMHANFMVNEGNGTSAAALELLALAQGTVREKFGVSLQTEVKIWV
ncbi:MAG: UDP-N-acetylenolpyruvoylglucosamine reductase [Desulfovibrio sp.]